jgi:hypothetical protein
MWICPLVAVFPLAVKNFWDQQQEKLG